MVIIIEDELCHGKTCPDMILLILCYIHTHTYIHIHTHVTTIGALVSLQPIIPPGCSEGLDVFGFFFKNLPVQYNTSTATASVSGTKCSSSP